MSWTVEGVQEVEVRVGSPVGPLLSRKAGSGSAKTGPWVRDGMVFYLRDASDGGPLAGQKTLDSVVVRLLGRDPQAESSPPPVGRVRFGDLRRVKPISRDWGFDRGLPVDRFYVERFLESYAADIHGHVLEVGDASYTDRFGGSRVTKSDVLNVKPGIPGTTIIADLGAAPELPADTFDCLIFTQTLQLIYDAAAAIRTLHRMLKPGGVVLATMPGISQTYDREWGAYWYWSFTPHSAQRLFADRFGPENVEVRSLGNVLAAVAFLEGLAAEELTSEELEARESGYEISICVRAVKA